MRKVFFVAAMMAAGFVMGQNPGFFLDDWQEKSADLPAYILKEKPFGESTIQITVDGDSILKKVPHWIYGNNAVTWGGNMNGHATIMKDISNLDPHVLRWPGGNLSQDYFWNLSSGDRPSDIPSDINAQYGMNVENWRMSTPQYYQLLESTRSTGSICVNYSYARYGTGPDPVSTAAHMAAQWVRYDQGRTKFWEIGNENFGNWESGYEIDITRNQDGQPKFISGQLYGQHCKVFIDSMRSAAAEIGVDIKIGVVAYDAETSYDPINTYWNEGMMPEVGDLADFLIVHSYFTPHNQDSPSSVILNSHDVPSHIMKDIIADMEEAGKPMIPVALTEWNIFAVRSMQQVSYINGMHAALVLGELVLNDYGLATRWDLTNGWSDGNDHGMFSRAGEPGVDLYNPRPVFFYMYYFQKYFGDRMVRSVQSGSEELISYASTFSSGETGLVLINKSSSGEVAEIKLENIQAGSWYHTMTLTGGTDNGEFSRKVFLNGVGGDEEGGGPDNYEQVKAHSAAVRGGIKVEVPALSVVYLLVEKPGPFSYQSSRIEEAHEINMELSQNVQEVTDPAGFSLKYSNSTDIPVLAVERDSLAHYQLNLTLESEILNSDTVLLSYNGTTIKSLKDEMLPAFEDEMVTNNLPGDPYRVTFQIKCKHTDSPLEDCQVLMNNEEGFSDENGMLSFPAQPGSYLVDVQKDHLVPVMDKELSVKADTLITISLDSVFYELVFHITDQKDGSPLSSVNVSKYSLEEKSDGNGLADFKLYAGLNSFTLERFNFHSLVHSFELVSDSLFEVQMERSHAQTKFRLRYGEQPVNKAAVEINGETVISNQLGQSLFPSIPVGTSLDYMVTHEGFETIEGQVMLIADSTILLQLEKKLTTQDPVGNSGAGIRIYPNPVHEQIFLDSEPDAILDLELMDLSGKILFRQSPGSNQHTIHLNSTISPGFYLLKLRTEKSTYVERIMKVPGSL